MAKSDAVRKRGRPATGQDPVSAIRLSAELTKAIDKWAAANGAPSRSEAIRRLVEHALGIPEALAKRSKLSATKARVLAGKEIDQLGDASLPQDERKRRKRRLTRGPVEFRDMRSDLPKRKS